MSQDERLTIIRELLNAMQTEPEQQTATPPPTLPKMRTLPQAVQEIRTADPDTAITVTALRRAVKSGRIPFVQVASKTLVNMASVYDYFTGKQLSECNNEKQIIRRVGL